MHRVIAVSLALGGLIACESLSTGAVAGGDEAPQPAVEPAAAAPTAPAPTGARTTPAGLTITMHKIDANGVGSEIGTIMLTDTEKGLRIEPALGNLPPGQRGFHIHEKGDCGPGEKDGKMQAGLAAGSHYDPDKTGKHLGPTGAGHKGDMPVLKVDKNGNASEVMFVERLKIADLSGRSIMIHEGGDNYADEPKPLGGGGARIACGVVK